MGFLVIFEGHAILVAYYLCLEYKMFVPCKYLPPSLLDIRIKEITKQLTIPLVILILYLSVTEEHLALANSVERAGAVTCLICKVRIVIVCLA